MIMSLPSFVVAAFGALVEGREYIVADKVVERHEHAKWSYLISILIQTYEKSFQDLTSWWAFHLSEKFVNLGRVGLRIEVPDGHMLAILHWVVHAKSTLDSLLHQLKHVIWQDETILERSNEQNRHLNLLNYFIWAPVGIKKANEWIDVDNFVHQHVMKVWESVFKHDSLQLISVSGLSSEIDRDCSS